MDEFWEAQFREEMHELLDDPYESYGTDEEPPLAQRIRRRCGYAGVRVGEASHPGPTGGGSRRTVRIRANGVGPKQNIGGFLGGAGIERAIKSIIELLVSQVVNKVMAVVVKNLAPGRL